MLAIVISDDLKQSFKIAERCNECGEDGDNYICHRSHPGWSAHSFYVVKIASIRFLMASIDYQD
jgi:hypothetical protein